jgi:hypothetical protein
MPEAPWHAAHCADFALPAATSPAIELPDINNTKIAMLNEILAIFISPK